MSGMNACLERLVKKCAQPHQPTAGGGGCSTEGSQPSGWGHSAFRTWGKAGQGDKQSPGRQGVSSLSKTQGRQRPVPWNSYKTTASRSYKLQASFCPVTGPVFLPQSMTQPGRDTSLLSLPATRAEKHIKKDISRTITEYVFCSPQMGNYKEEGEQGNSGDWTRQDNCPTCPWPQNAFWFYFKAHGKQTMWIATKKKAEEENEMALVQLNLCNPIGQDPGLFPVPAPRRRAQAGIRSSGDRRARMPALSPGVRTAWQHCVVFSPLSQPQVWNLQIATSTSSYWPSRLCTENWLKWVDWKLFCQNRGLQWITGWRPVFGQALP